MKIILLILMFLVGFSSGWISQSILNSQEKSTINETLEKIIERPLEKYEFEKLSSSYIKPGNIKVKELIAENDKYNSYLFEYEFNPNLDGKTKRVTTGQLNIPINGSEVCTNCPLVLMFRGYVDQENYVTGDGTRRAAEYFAQNGFLTIAPDFLGYGGSDEESGNIFETRFQTYVTALSLLKTIEGRELITISSNSKIPNFSTIKLLSSDTPIFIWGHSNGGQIAITLLELSEKSYPTALWAPVTKPFPYSVLYYTDDSEDSGKLIRSELAKFEALYDVEKYSLTNYFEKIKSPIQLHQGLNDDAIPVEWSREFTQKLKKLDKDITLFEYLNTDHNMRPSWDEVVEKDLSFYKSFIN